MAAELPRALESIRLPKRRRRESRGTAVTSVPLRRRHRAIYDRTGTYQFGKSDDVEKSWQSIAEKTALARRRGGKLYYFKIMNLSYSELGVIC